MKYVVFIIIALIVLNSCNQKKEISQSEVTKIEVYHIPFELLFPTQSNESSIRKVKNYSIVDNATIKEIKMQIANLSSSKWNKFNENNIYLLCDFYTKDGRTFTLKFDKNYIDIDGSSYHNNVSLISILTKD